MYTTICSGQGRMPSTLIPNFLIQIKFPGVEKANWTGKNACWWLITEATERTCLSDRGVGPGWGM